MDVINGVFLIVVGLATMGLGLFLFYAMLPLFYAFFGFGVGYELGLFLTSTPADEFSVFRLAFAGGGAVVFAAGAYFLEPFRRVLLGIGLGSLLGGLIANALGLTGFLGVVIMAIAAFIGAGIVLRVFDAFIIGATALGGAGLAMDGAHLVFRSLGILDRTTIVNGAVTPLIIWLVLGAIAIGWQFKNLEKWTKKTRQPI